MDFLQDILREKGGDLAAGLVEKAGFSTEQARSFLPEAASSVFDVAKAKAGDLDLSDLAGSTESLVGGVDVGALAQKVGIDSSKASSGLQALVPMLLSALGQKAGGLSQLSSLLGGEGIGKALGGATDIGGMAGKLFNR